MLRLLVTHWVVPIIFYLLNLPHGKFENWNPSCLDDAKNEVSDWIIWRSNCVHHLDCVLKVKDSQLRKFSDLFLWEILFQDFLSVGLSPICISEQDMPQLDNSIILFDESGLFRLVRKLISEFELNGWDKSLFNSASVELCEYLLASWWKVLLDTFRRETVAIGFRRRGGAGRCDTWIDKILLLNCVLDHSHSIDRMHVTRSACAIISMTGCTASRWIGEMIVVRWWSQWVIMLLLQHLLHKLCLLVFS